MANTFAPFGFRAFGRAEGGAPTAGQTKITLNSSDTNLYFTGDVVMISSAGALTLPASGSVTGSTFAAPIAGIFNGCEFYNPSVGRVVWSSWFPGNLGTSSAPGNAYVYTDPDQLFLVQGSSAGVLGSSTIGYNVGFASTSQGSGNQLSGISAEFLASSSPASVNTLPFRIMDVYTNTAPPGVNGTSTGTEGFQIVVVQMNNQYRRSLTGMTS